jgi:hypothetical protein
MRFNLWRETLVLCSEDQYVQYCMLVTLILAVSAALMHIDWLMVKNDVDVRMWRAGN